jgi:multiple sugar transport system permease protein
VVGAVPATVRRWLSRHESAIFLAPPAGIVLLLSIFPLVTSLALAFGYWDYLSPTGGFRLVGLANWSRLFSDDIFRRVAVNTIGYVLLAIPIQYLIGLGLALVLNQQIRGRTFFRVFFMIPMMLSPVAVAFMVGRMMFNEAQGPINYLLTHVGLSGLPWLTSSRLAFVTVVLVDSWQWIPLITLLLLTGLQGLPVEVLEAARLETRSALQAFWHVTMPLLLPWSITAVLLRFVELLKIVDVPKVLTNGGPGISTESLSQYAYVTGLNNLDLGYGSAIAYALLILAVVGATLFLLLFRRRLADVLT